MTDDERLPLPIPAYEGLRDGILDLLNTAREQAARRVNALMTATYWEIGRRIVEIELDGADRAVYGDVLVERLADDLGRRFGRGFSRSNLFQMRVFYAAWPADRIVQTVSGQSNPATAGLRIERLVYLWRQRLDRAIADHEEHDSHDDYLLLGPALKEAEGKLSAQMPESLSDRQRDFITRGVERRDRVERRAKEDRAALQQKERAALAMAAAEERKARHAAETAQGALARAAVEERSARRAAERAHNAEHEKLEVAERAKRTGWSAAAALLALTVIALGLYWQADARRKSVTAQSLMLRANELATDKKFTTAMARTLWRAHHTEPEQAANRAREPLLHLFGGLGEDDQPAALRELFVLVSDRVDGFEEHE